MEIFSILNIKFFSNFLTHAKKSLLGKLLLLLKATFLREEFFDFLRVLSGSSSYFEIIN